ncbi:hypothetical protein ACGFNU_01900 [Spirillospora sp. NPDC048911]|uniref:hypothetical protein n=1 Tax=Spirillospora sp. NPDC048911 TaxID=3364527 RepID=UPI00371F9249
MTDQAEDQPSAAGSLEGPEAVQAPEPEPGTALPEPSPGATMPELRPGDAASEPVAGEEAARSYDVAYVEQLRRENASWRLKVRDLESRGRETEVLIVALGRDFGIVDAPEETGEEGEPPAPDVARVLSELRARLTARDAELRTLKIEQALERAAERHDADPELVVPVLAHSGGLAGLDPDADGFQALLDDLVERAVENNPKLRATQVAQRGGAEFPGRSGTAGSAVAPGMDRLRHAYANLST